MLHHTFFWYINLFLVTKLTESLRQLVKMTSWEAVIINYFIHGPETIEQKDSIVNKIVQTKVI